MIDLELYREQFGDLETAVREMFEGMGRDRPRRRPRKKADAAHLDHLIATAAEEAREALRAAERGDVWEAVLRATLAGMFEGQKMLFPDFASGENLSPAGKVGGTTGGRGRAADPVGPTRAELCAAAAAMHASYPAISFTEVCRKVGKRFGKSGRQVQRDVAAVDWRKKKVRH